MKEFRAIDPRQSRIILLEGGPRVLPAYPEDLSASAERQLKQMGVEVRTSAMVTNIEPGVVSVGKEKIPAAVILWGAGVAASPLGKMLGVATDKAGRVIVERDLSVPGHPEVFVAGDLASAMRHNGQPVPGVAPAAIQMGKFAARQIKRSVAGKPRQKFEYLDKGSLATIGRSHAVADLGKLHFSGLLCLAGLAVHPFAVPDRVPQSLLCDDRMGMGVHYVQPQRAADHRPYGTRACGKPKSQSGLIEFKIQIRIDGSDAHA